MMVQPYEVTDLYAYVARWGAKGPIEGPPQQWPGDRANFVRVREFLVPKRAGIFFRCYLVPPGSQSTAAQAGPRGVWDHGITPGGRLIAEVEGYLDVRNGTPEVLRIDVRKARSEALSASMLGRVPVTEVAYRAVASLSLTSRQTAEYVFLSVPDSAEDFWGQWISSRFGAGKAPVEVLPKPALIDADGRPWWQVRVTARGAHELQKDKHPKRGPDFMTEVLAVYRAAIADERSGPDAVADHFDKPRGSSTVFRWIQQAKQLGGDHAQDQ